VLTQGIVHHQHSSGVKFPTDKAFLLYASHHKDIAPAQASIDDNESREVKALIHKVSETISDELKLTCFTSLPIFEHDFIQKIKCHLIDDSKLLCVLITDYGQVRTEILYICQEVSKDLLKKVETYFLHRLGKGQKPFFKTEKEFQFAKKVYTELMLRHALLFGNSLKSNLFKTGLSFLMEYPELNNAKDLSASLLLFENEEIPIKLLKETMEKKDLTFWIGNDLSNFLGKEANFSIIAIPYFINQSPAGAIALLGPCRIDYKNVFSLLKQFSKKISASLTKNIYKHKIPFHTMYEEEKIDISDSILLEDKSR